MFGLQPIHLLFIAIVALVIFGPKRLPQLGHWLGKSVREFRKGAQEMSTQFREENAGSGAQERRSRDDPAPRQAPAPAPQSVSAAERPCGECNALNPQKSRFCSQCGARLS